MARYEFKIHVYMPCSGKEVWYFSAMRFTLRVICQVIQEPQKLLSSLNPLNVTIEFFLCQTENIQPAKICDNISLMNYAPWLSFVTTRPIPYIYCDLVLMNYRLHDLKHGGTIATTVTTTLD